MTVSELIAALQDLPPDLEVEAEGCDCVNPVRGAGVYELGPRGAEYQKAIVVCGPDFYGIVGPSYAERQRQRYAERYGGA